MFDLKNSFETDSGSWEGETPAEPHTDQQRLSGNFAVPSHENLGINRFLRRIP